MATTSQLRSTLNGTGTRLHDAASRWPLAPVGLGVFLYSTGPVMIAASSVSAPVFSLWRLWFGVGVFALLASVHFGLGAQAPTGAALRYTVVAGLVFGVHQVLFMTAIKTTSVVDVLLVTSLSPVATAILAIPMFGERPGLRFCLCSVVAIAGSGVVILAGSSGPEGEPLGMLFAFFNVFLFTIFFLLSKRGRDYIDVVPFLLGVMVVAAVVISTFVIATGAAVWSMERQDFALAFATATVPGALGHFVMTWPLQWVPANVPPVMRLSMPILSGLLAWALLDEAITSYHVIGGALTLAGVAGALLSPSGRPLVAREAAAGADID